jgi:hypothetical protein
MAPFVYTGPGCRVPKDVVTITVQHGVTSIGDYAFIGCTSLTSLQGLPDTLTSIGGYAFRGCTSLTSLQGLPDTLTSIGYEAFRDCTSLTSIGDGFRPDCAVEQIAFSNCPLLQAAATANGFSNPIDWGKAVWLKPNLRWAVLSCVRSVRLAMEQQDDDAVCVLLRRLSAVPSADNSTPHTESQVLRRIVEYVGKGIVSDVPEGSGG